MISLLPKYRIILGFASIYLIWGSTYLGVRIAVETIPPFLMAGLRFTSGGLLLYYWMRFRGTEKPHWTLWLPAGLVGIIIIAGCHGPLSWAQKTIPSGLAALLVATIPMWMVLIDWIRPGGQRPKLSVVLGIIIGFAGIVALINPVGFASNVITYPFGAVVIVFAAMSWAAGSICSQHVRRPESKVLNAGMQMIAGGCTLLAISVLSGETATFDFAIPSVRSWMGLIYLIIMGSIGFASYIWLLSVRSVAKVSTYAFVNPVIALILGHIIVGEVLNLRILGCAAAILSAVIIIIMTKDRNAEQIYSQHKEHIAQCIKT